MAKNTPNNQALHNEGEQRLQALLQQRNQQDQGVYSPIVTPSPTQTSSTIPITTNTIPSSTVSLMNEPTATPVHYYSLSG